MYTPRADLPGKHPPGQTPLGRQTPPRDSYCSRRYASYWNAFLLHNISCFQTSKQSLQFDFVTKYFTNKMELSVKNVTIG